MDIIMILEEHLRSEYERFNKNMAELKKGMDWIEKNITDKRRMELEELEMRKSDLQGWETKVFKQKGTEDYPIQLHNEKYSEELLKFEQIIQSALRDVEFRIKRKEKNKISGKKKEQENYWNGTSSQKQLLFDELAKADYIKDNEENRSSFLNNKIVKWKNSGRLLFYLLEELKGKKLKLLPQTLNLSPFINANFVDVNGAPFKNINQSKSGMYNTNSKSKPRGGEKIDIILKTLYPTTR